MAFWGAAVGESAMGVGDLWERFFFFFFSTRTAKKSSSTAGRLLMDKWLDQGDTIDMEGGF